MPTVFHSRRRYRIVVQSNDHPPPHVHAIGQGVEARFKIHCSRDEVEIWDHQGPWKLIQLNELGEEIAQRLDECCEVWRKIHG